MKCVDLKKLLIVGLFMISPYVLSNYFIFIFLVPLLYLFYSKRVEKDSHLAVFIFMLIVFVLFPVVTYDFSTYIFGVIIASLFIISFILASKKLIVKFSDSSIAILIPGVVWVSLLYLLNVRSLMASAFDIGILFPTSAPVIWYTGSIGLTLLIIVFNSALARFLAKKDKVSLIIFLTLLAVFLFSHLYSISKDPSYLYTPKGAKRIALVQGDIPSKTIFGYTERLNDRIERYIKISERSGKEDIDLIIWPEFTLPVDVINRFPQKMNPIISEIRKSGKEYIIGSMLTENEYSYNTAIIFSRDGSIKDIYYSEDPAIFNRNISSRKNGDKLYLGNIGITLCWEEINEKIFRNYVNKGAGSFISLSSNTDLDYSWFKKYASFFSRARAAESMRFLARTAQTGMTHIINPFGKVVKYAPVNKSTFITGEIPSIDKKTFYSQHGDVLTKIFVLLIIIILVMNKASENRRRLS